MINVESYIKDENEFVIIDNYTGSVPDPDYIDSAIELEINGVNLITRAESDYMVPLWAYIANGFEELSDKSEWKTYFPDQPIRLTLKRDEQNRNIEIEVNIPESRFVTASPETRRAVAPYKEFLKVMSEAGQKFFRRMAEIVPEERADYEREADRMRDAVQALQRP